MSKSNELKHPKRGDRVVLAGEDRDGIKIHPAVVTRIAESGALDILVFFGGSPAMERTSLRHFLSRLLTERSVGGRGPTRGTTGPRWRRNLIGLMNFSLARGTRLLRRRPLFLS